jgi:hypothetical protein
MYTRLLAERIEAHVMFIHVLENLFPDKSVNVCEVFRCHA